MADEHNEEDLQAKLAARLKSLPKVVRDSITSASVQEHLRELANMHKLHLDQWQLLENEVMLTLLGFQDPEDFKQSIKDDLVVTDDVASALTADISKVVFDPIREQLERELDHPDAVEKTATGVEQLADQSLAAREPVATITPLAPAPTAPETKAVRAPISETYKPGEPSAARKDVANDPYREPPV